MRKLASLLPCPTAIRVAESMVNLGSLWLEQTIERLPFLDMEQITNVVKLKMEIHNFRSSTSLVLLNPEKYAESKPPTAALPQQRDCNPPAILGSFESRVLSATTSEKAIHAELITNETTVAGIFRSGLESKSPQN
ncbi:hypothetical protein IV203_025228 [Nitzschia inconspicua]|uniref:Uncharacterized protein n=1 Tax=Nitzschia inconspicua TaxID=303405 RepID=A0A9K3LH62_9STRA|nr:hypothetical protein IV203_025228 [Nitzschia inconspicua]